MTNRGTCLPTNPDTEFRLARQFVTHYRVPLVFWVALPVESREPDSGVLDNHGYQFILFQPGTGNNCRVHFAYDAGGAVRICPGEFGDAM